MLTQAQIDAQNEVALTPEQVQAIELLVKRFPLYYNNVGLFPSLHDTLLTEQTTPTIKTKALKAVLVQLGDLPSLVVESQGSHDRPSHFATTENWEELAFDVLNTLYSLPAGLARQSFAITRQWTNHDYLRIYRGIMSPFNHKP